jgi:hypothetical protein
VIAISYNRAEFRGQFERLLERTRNPAALLMICGRELGNQLKAHFRRKDRNEPNRLSARRQHFWLGVSRTVSAPALAGAMSVRVNVSHPAIAQKVFGGQIVAKRAGALTIPVEERAYGRTAATFERETGLKLFRVGGWTGAAGGGGGALAVKAAGGGISVEYVLRRSVMQEADPTALPEEGDLERAIMKRGQAVVDRLNANATG